MGHFVIKIQRLEIIILIGDVQQAEGDFRPAVPEAVAGIGVELPEIIAGFGG